MCHEPIHGIGGISSSGSDSGPVASFDVLVKEVGDDRVDMVLVSPSFGKSSFREEFWSVEVVLAVDGEVA
ncbi:MAG: hypothetical protein V7721_06540 [Porticoccaceae bacterium]